MEIKKIEYDFSVCKVKDAASIDLTEQFCFVGKTDEELSMVCMTENAPEELGLSSKVCKFFFTPLSAA